MEDEWQVSQQDPVVRVKGVSIDSQPPLGLRRFFPLGTGLIAVMCHLPGFGIALHTVPPHPSEWVLQWDCQLG